MAKRTIKRRKIVKIKTIKIIIVNSKRYRKGAINIIINRISPI